jgi:hypothetical protein
MRKEIVQKIIDILKGDDALKEPDKVRKYYFGYPPSASHFYPFIAVKLSKPGPVEVHTAQKERHSFTVEIIVEVQYIKEDESEKQCLDLLDRIEDVMDENPTLNGIVTDGRVVETFSQGAHPGSYSYALTPVGKCSVVSGVVVFSCYIIKT